MGGLAIQRQPFCGLKLGIICAKVQNADEPPPPGNEHQRSVRTHLYSSVTEYLLQRIIGEVALSSCNNHWHLNMGEPFFQTAGRRKLILLVITIGVFLRVPPFQLFSFQRAVMN